MSLTHFFYEPFYSTNDLECLLDEAFKSGPNTQEHRSGVIKPRYGYMRQCAVILTLMTFRCRMDLCEQSDGNTVTATFDLLGLKKEDVQIEIHNGLLSVSGECGCTSKKDEGRYAIRERCYGKFSRSIRLPQGIKVSPIPSL
jgi:HSP20 family protein